MDGEYVCVSHEDLWKSSRAWSDAQAVSTAVIPTLDAFETECGIEFHASLGRDGLYVYRVMDTQRLVMATLRYGWRVTPLTT